MTKDYAKNRSRFAPKPNNRYQQNGDEPIGLPSWAWMLLGLAFGIAISAFIFWKSTASRHLAVAELQSQETQLGSEADPAPKSKNNNKNKDQNKNKNKNTDKIAKKPKNDKNNADLMAIARPEARFDFYTLLPAISVDTPDNEGTQASRQGTLPYIIQAGSFKTREQADKLKATLALQGLEARIQTVIINPSESWYRVYMGPFDTKADALGLQQNLEDGQNLNSVILKVRV